MKKVTLIQYILFGVSLFIMTLFSFSCTSKKNNPSKEEIINIYNENSQLMEKIREELFVQYSTPEYLVIYMDEKMLMGTYGEGDSFLIDDSNLSTHILQYFEHVNSFSDTTIRFRNLFGHIVLEFSFFDKSIDTGIVYTQDKLFGEEEFERIEGDWYIFWYGMV